MKTDRDSGFLPNFCAIRSVFVVVVSAELLAIVLTLAAMPDANGFWALLSLRSLYIQWIALAVAGLLCALRSPLERLSNTAAGLLAWLLILLVTAGLFALADYLDLRGERAALPAMLQHLLIAGIVGAVVLRYLYEQHRERQREVAESQARVQALQARIRPHFLFNSMNTIASLTRGDPDLAEQVVQDLSDLFRASLADAATWSTLERELELAQGYLRIERHRLGDRLRLEWRVDTVPLQLGMPALLLQPLLENAVYHGVEPSTTGGDIRVHVAEAGGQVKVRIFNSMPQDAAVSHRRGNRLALDNVRERLAAMFGDGADLIAGPHGDGYQVELRMPAAS